MIIECISDLHGYYPNLNGGDVLIVAGDVGALSDLMSYLEFIAWLRDQPHRAKIVVPGNHDKYFWDCYKMGCMPFFLENTFFLVDIGVSFEGIKFWGSPWVQTFEGINPEANYFTVQNDEDLSERWELIPHDTNVLITHGPPRDAFDRVKGEKRVGSYSLKEWLRDHNPQLHIFGHIHEAHGVLKYRKTICANVSYVDGRYRPFNSSETFELREKKTKKGEFICAMKQIA